jgi:hypothetical protein
MGKFSTSGLRLKLMKMWWPEIQWNPFNYLKSEKSSQSIGLRGENKLGLSCGSTQQVWLISSYQILAFIKVVFSRGRLPSFQTFEHLIENCFESYMTSPINVKKQVSSY